MIISEFTDEETKKQRIWVIFAVTHLTGGRSKIQIWTMWVYSLLSAPLGDSVFMDTKINFKSFKKETELKK